MMRKWLGAAAVAIVAMGGLSCARNQHVVSLQIRPTSGTIFGAADTSLLVNYKAYATYEHPPETKDVTDQATWISDSPSIAAVNAKGVAGRVGPAGVDCGAGNVYATLKDGGNLVLSNSAQITVDGPSSSGCTPAGPLPILTVTLTGAGTVSSVPLGIDCTAPSSCNASFTAGTTVTLTATDIGGTNITWSGCNSSLGNQCTVVMEQNIPVTVTLN